MKVVNRIKKSNDFSIVINKGTYDRLPSFKVFTLKTDNKYARVGISVSKKIGGAVTRNRAKRQVRAMCDQIISYNDLSYDIVIILKYTFLETSFDDNKSQLSDLLQLQVGQKQ